MYLAARFHEQPKFINSNQPDFSINNLRKHAIFSYNTSFYPFREVVRDILQRQNSELPMDFGNLHKYNDFNIKKTLQNNDTIDVMQYIWNMERGRDSKIVEEKYKKFDDLYNNFMLQELGPQLGGGKIIYQRAPTLRIYHPLTGPLGKLHNDRDYNHQPSEINFWLPLSDAFGNNSLWVESEPNKGDFKPLNLHYGQYCRFYGNQCRHFTFRNNTNTTRVSLDFRAVSTHSGGHDPTFRQGVWRGSKSKYQRSFDVGGFYSEINTNTETSSLINF
eukprot:gene7790-10584_t